MELAAGGDPILSKEGNFALKSFSQDSARGFGVEVRVRGRLRVRVTVQVRVRVRVRVRVWVQVRVRVRVRVRARGRGRGRSRGRGGSALCSLVIPPAGGRPLLCEEVLGRAALPPRCPHPTRRT